MKLLSIILCLFTLSCDSDDNGADNVLKLSDFNGKWELLSMCGEYINTCPSQAENFSICFEDENGNPESPSGNSLDYFLFVDGYVFECLNDNCEHINSINIMDLNNNTIEFCEVNSDFCFYANAEINNINMLIIADMDQYYESDGIIFENCQKQLTMILEKIE